MLDNIKVPTPRRTNALDPKNLASISNRSAKDLFNNDVHTYFNLLKKKIMDAAEDRINNVEWYTPIDINEDVLLKIKEQLGEGGGIKIDDISPEGLRRRLILSW